MWFIIILGSVSVPRLLASYGSKILPLGLSISEAQTNPFMVNDSDLSCPQHNAEFFSSPEISTFKHVNRFQPPVRLTQYRNGFFKSRCFADTVDWDIEELCIFVNPTINHGNGMVIVASESTLAKSFKQGLDLSSDAIDPEAISIVKVPEKGGMGAVAARKLELGDPVVSERPVGLFPCSMSLWQTDYGKNIRRQAIDHLPTHTRAAVSRLHGVGTTEDDFLSDVIDKNVFSTALSGDEETEYGALVLDGSRLNHDCRPNVSYYIDPKTQLFHMKALEAIEVGAELTDSYRWLDISRKDRRDGLKSAYGFECTCSHCQMSEEDGKLSDERVLRIRVLLQQEATAPEQVQELLDLCELENIPWCKVHANFNAATFYNSQGKPDKVKQHVEISKKLGLILAGSSWDDLDEVELLLNAPEKHHSHFSQL